MAEDELGKFEKLIAKALSDAEGTEIREIIAQAIRERLTNYQCERVFGVIVDPIIREMAMQVLKEPAISEALQARVRSEAHRILGSLTVSPGRGY